MGFQLKLVSNALGKTGNFNTVTAGTVVGMNPVPMNDIRPGTLSARLALTAATSTITMAMRWQVSDDGSTWEDVLLEGEGAITDLTITTGTAAIKTVHAHAPDSVYGKRFCRVSVVIGVTTGGASDLYDVKYDYAKNDFQ